MIFVGITLQTHSFQFMRTSFTPYNRACAGTSGVNVSMFRSLLCRMACWAHDITIGGE